MSVAGNAHVAEFYGALGIATIAAMFAHFKWFANWRWLARWSASGQP